MHTETSGITYLYCTFLFSLAFSQSPMSIHLFLQNPWHHKKNCHQWTSLLMLVLRPAHQWCLYQIFSLELFTEISQDLGKTFLRLKVHYWGRWFFTNGGIWWKLFVKIETKSCSVDTFQPIQLESILHSLRNEWITAMPSKQPSVSTKQQGNSSGQGLETLVFGKI